MSNRWLTPQGNDPISMIARTVGGAMDKTQDLLYEGVGYCACKVAPALGMIGAKGAAAAMSGWGMAKMGLSPDDGPSREESLQQLDPNARDQMANLEAALGVSSIEEGQSVSASQSPNVQSAAYNGPDRRAEGAYRSREMDEYFSKNRGADTADA